MNRPSWYLSSCFEKMQGYIIGVSGREWGTEGILECRKGQLK